MPYGSADHTYIGMRYAYATTEGLCTALSLSALLSLHADDWSLASLSPGTCEVRTTRSTARHHRQAGPREGRLRGHMLRVCGYRSAQGHSCPLAIRDTMGRRDAGIGPARHPGRTARLGRGLGKEYEAVYKAPISPAATQCSPTQRANGFVTYTSRASSPWIPGAKEPDRRKEINHAS